jgi:PAS domain S-box-containing protein
MPEPEAPQASGISDLFKRQQAVVAMGRRTVASPGIDVLLQDAADLMAELLEVDHCLVAELSSVDNSIRATLTCTSEGAGQPTTGDLGTDANESLAAYALHVAHPLAVDDLASETRFRDHWLLAQGIRSALAVPLRFSDCSFGTLAACSRQLRPFSATDLLFAETIAHLVTTAIARGQSEKARDVERSLSNGVLQTVGSLVLVLDGQGQIQALNRACERITGFQLAEVQGRALCDTLLPPDERGLFQIIFARILESTNPVEFEGFLLTKRAEQRRIAWSYAAVSDGQHGVQSVLATGIDITELRQAEANAAEAIATAKAQQAAKDDYVVEPTDVVQHATDKLSDPDNLINRERRRRPRRSYPYRQLIAPVIDRKLPPKTAFVEIECNDIAAGGFSFLSPQPPPSHSLIVALGIAPKLTYLSAEVVHVTRIQHQEQSKYLIGCAYNGRVNY